MKTINIPQKSDASFTLEVEGIDLTTAVSLGVIVSYGAAKKTLLEKFSKVASVGWKLLTVTYANGVSSITIKVQSDKTTNAKVGDYYAEIWAKWTDTGYADGKQDLVNEGFYLFSIVESQANSLELP